MTHPLEGNFISIRITQMRKKCPLFRSKKVLFNVTEDCKQPASIHFLLAPQQTNTDRFSATPDLFKGYQVMLDLCP